MKGIVFSEFIELVEEKFGYEVADQIIVESESKLESGGAYTAVGTYDHSEMVTLVGNLSEVSGVPVPQLLGVFGEHLFSRFHELYPELFEGVSDTRGFLLRLEDYIHAQVRKLYPDADLPKFTYEASEDDTLIMEYHSSRGFGDLAEGLIRGCIAYYKDPLNVTLEDLVRFTIG